MKAEFPEGSEFSVPARRLIRRHLCVSWIIIEITEVSSSFDLKVRERWHFSCVLLITGVTATLGPSCFAFLTFGTIGGVVFWDRNPSQSKPWNHLKEDCVRTWSPNQSLRNSALYIFQTQWDLSGDTTLSESTTSHLVNEETVRFGPWAMRWDARWGAPPPLVLWRFFTTGSRGHVLTR